MTSVISGVRQETPPVQDVSETGITLDDVAAALTASSLLRNAIGLVEAPSTLATPTVITEVQATPSPEPRAEAIGSAVVGTQIEESSARRVPKPENPKGKDWFDLSPAERVTEWRNRQLSEPVVAQGVAYPADWFALSPAQRAAWWQADHRGNSPGSAETSFYASQRQKERAARLSGIYRY